LTVRPWGGWVATSLVGVLALGWLFSVGVRIRDPDVLAWTMCASICIGVVASAGGDGLVRWAPAGLATAALLRVPARLRNVFGAFVLIGVPWLSLIAVVSASKIGRVTIYSAGDDFWTFQRFAYRIFMQGYWLEGGERTFWYQPLYRWIAGALHMIFGDSSVGEWYWDGAGLLAAALLGFYVTKTFAGFRWGLIAAVAVLTVSTTGPTRVFIGRGLSEISSAGFAYLGAFFALRSRRGCWSAAIAAGVLATLAFYTRLNNLPLSVGIVAFALPIREPIRTIWHWRRWRRASAVTAVGVIGTISLGLFLFALRTWHYTGVFSVFQGTGRYALAIWQPGLPLGVELARMADSVTMVLTMNDPARFDPLALPLLIGFFTSLLAVTGARRLRALPAPAVLFCLAAVAGALVARGSAYPGRFSIHVIGAATTVAVCLAAQFWKQIGGNCLISRIWAVCLS
jgi:hypothetical protein